MQRDFSSNTDFGVYRTGAVQSERVRQAPFAAAPAPEVKPTLSIDVLRANVDYDPDTGVAFWKTRFTSAVRLDKPIGSHSRGYLITKLHGFRLSLHRMAFAIVHGRWPVQIDHINGIRTDNRIANLRECDSSINNQNRQGAYVNNKLGVLGVRKRRGRYVAQIWAGGSARHIGTFDTAEEAHQAYLAAKRVLHPGNTI